MAIVPFPCWCLVAACHRGLDGCGSLAAFLRCWFGGLDSRRLVLRFRSGITSSWSLVTLRNGRWRLHRDCVCACGVENDVTASFNSDTRICPKRTWGTTTTIVTSPRVVILLHTRQIRALLYLIVVLVSECVMMMMMMITTNIPLVLANAGPKPLPAGLLATRCHKLVQSKSAH